jgi:hypothetical protein
MEYMADTTNIKKQIKDIVRLLSKEYGTVLKEESVLENKPNGLKFNGVSKEKDICLFVCGNKPRAGKVDAGQLDSIFRRCYLLTLSPYSKKLLVFINKEFYNKFMEKYSDYLGEIEAIYKELPEEN